MPDLSLRRLSLRHLRLLCVLGDALNLRKTAEILHTSQPALSRSLAELEEIVGAKLFDRTTKRITPTPAGVAMLHHAQRILAEVDGVQVTLAAIRMGVQGALRVGVISAVCPALVAQTVDRMSARYPDLQVSISLGGLTAQYESLLAGRIDLMFAPVEFSVDASVVQVAPAYIESTWVYARDDHPLASLADVADSDLAAHPWVLPPADVPLRARINRMLALHRTQGAPAVRDVETGAFGIAMELARHCGLLCAVPSRLAPHDRSTGLVRLASPIDLLTGPIAGFRLRSSMAGVACDAFLQAVREVADGVAA